tara:strand:- start:1907 stop:2221 length:315 start_codon:yes stop_codon:yes gene_type:complete
MPKELYLEIGEQMKQNHGCQTGQMFGKPCLKTNGKAFAAFFKEQMVFKIGAEEIKEIKEKYPSSKNWDPSGKNRAMKDWLQVPNEFQDDWESLATQAMNFVSKA